MYLTIQCSLNPWLNSLLNSSIQGITYRVPEDEINHPSIPLRTQNRSTTKTTSKAENHTNNKRPSIGLFHNNNMLFIMLVLGVLLDATKLCNPLVWQVIAISEPHYHHLPSIHGGPPPNWPGFIWARILKIQTNLPTHFTLKASVHCRLCIDLALHTSISSKHTQQSFFIHSRLYVPVQYVLGAKHGYDYILKTNL